LKKKGKNQLTAKQKHFADEWLIDHNGTRAYKVAYPKIKEDKTAQAAASRLLLKVKVDTYIKTRQSEMAAKYEITQEKVLKNIVRIGCKAENKDKFGDALKAEEMLARHVKLFSDPEDDKSKDKPNVNYNFITVTSG